jgi:hypothetical protein
MSGTASDVHVEGIEKMIPAHTHMPRTSGNIVRARNNMRAHHYTDISATRVFQRQQSSRSGERARGRRAPKCARCFWPHLRIYVSASLWRGKKGALKSSAIGNLWLLRRRGIEINTYVRATIKVPKFCRHQSLLYLAHYRQNFTAHPRKCCKSDGESR